MRPARAVVTSLALAAAAAAVAVPSAGALPLNAGPTAAVGSATRAPLQPWLADQLAGLSANAPVTVLVHGRTLADASRAVAVTGMQRGTVFERIGVVVARGTAAQVTALRTQPGVTYLEGDQPLDLTQYTSNIATRGSEAMTSLTGADGTRLDGSGVSVAVIDSGVDPTHPYFQDEDGSAVVESDKVVCDPFSILCQVVDTAFVDTDTASAGGHGTHVSGIVAGREVTAGGKPLQGAAPGANLVVLSTGAGISIIGADAALEWVLENHEAPCGEGVPAAECPPIKVTNNSYGPSGGGEFDPNSATVKLQRALVAEGVVSVWANGNDGGDGSENLSNPAGQDPTPGILSVASYDDRGTGTRDGAISDFSSRGRAGDPSTYPDIAAPGDLITSACRITMPICSTGLNPVDGGNYNTISGTSMAAPHIAGIVAQLFQADPTATPAEVEQALKQSAYKFGFGAPYEPVGGITTSYDKGAGLVDAVAAVAALRG